jgi:hypothetical protein
MRHQRRRRPRDVSKNIQSHGPFAQILIRARRSGSVIRPAAAKAISQTTISNPGFA